MGIRTVAALPEYRTIVGPPKQKVRTVFNVNRNMFMGLIVRAWRCLTASGTWVPRKRCGNVTLRSIPKLDGLPTVA